MLTIGCRKQQAFGPGNWITGARTKPFF